MPRWVGLGGLATRIQKYALMGPLPPQSVPAPQTQPAAHGLAEGDPTNPARTQRPGEEQGVCVLRPTVVEITARLMDFINHPTVHVLLALYVNRTVSPSTCSNPAPWCAHMTRHTPGDAVGSSTQPPSHWPWTRGVVSSFPSGWRAASHEAETWNGTRPWNGSSRVLKREDSAFVSYAGGTLP